MAVAVVAPLPSMRMHGVLLLALLMAAGCDGSPPAPVIPATAKPRVPATPPPEPVPGIALVFILDTSGSMKQPVAGSGESRIEVACRALSTAVNRVDAWRAAGTPDAPRRIDSALLSFRGVEVPWGPFDPAPLLAWTGNFRSPDGPTPLGEAVLRASDLVLASPLVSKHLIVVTDGENTKGPLPEAAMDTVKGKAREAGALVDMHFIAFDLDAAVFEGVKARGATLASAASAEQLDKRLKFILEEEILLESDAPRPAGPGGR